MLNSFTDSYKLGARIIKGLSTSSMDDNLVSKHLFRACLENLETLNSTSHTFDSYNIYKDPTPADISALEQNEKVENCNYFFMLNDLLELVCCFCGVMQKSIDTIFEYHG
ncbi:putative metal-nicotianamine transporter YSL9 isoform X2 [Iris pallida]|uniref:Metal-nicotianamine transporter YSL9 isoform X2 n=1 Tax=Iris pallida TaxID=29817 RepID=A0AAX6FZS7_IRIPA|nr:putative metal-nicotianamine transporter YSL9 isoform X2 [Iris pallida]